MKKFGLILIISLITLTLKAQNEIDALRYSQITFGGTARYMGLGGAFGALGADISTLSTNPAGIGLYSKSEISFSPAVNASKITSVYNGTSLEENKYNFNISNIGGVFTYNSDGDEGSGCFGFNFGIGLNRLANFNNNYSMQGLNDKNSILSDFIDITRGSISDYNYDYLIYPAMETGLIAFDSARGYFSAVPNGGVLQSKTISTRGAMNEMYLTFGGNYMDKLYIGGTFGFPFIRYTETSTYKEENVADTLWTPTAHINYYLNDLSIDNYLSTTGSGFNFKFGLIYRPIDFIRLGIAIHTPSFLKLSDSYHTTIKSNFYHSTSTQPPYNPDGLMESYEQDSPDGDYNYELTTPFRAIGSIAFIIGKIGLVSADYEFVDYSDADLSAPDYAFSQENIAIKNIYTTAGNLRVGTEWRFNIFAVRAGYALYGSPYKANNNDAARSSYCGGFGIRDDNFFADFAYVYTTYKENYKLYNNVINPVNNSFVNQNFILTLGLKF